MHRLTNLSQAISELASSSCEITVPNVLPVYIRIAGYTGEDFAMNDAICAFERSLSKGKDEIAERLWNEYWYDKLGGSKEGDGKCYQCPACGGCYLKGKNPCEQFLKVKVFSTEEGKGIRRRQKRGHVARRKRAASSSSSTSSL